MKYTITAPNTAYNRKLCGVQFVDGVGQTDDELAASWFSGREGFTVTAVEPETEDKDESPKTKTVDEMTVVELKAYAAEKGIELKGAEKKADILVVIKETEGGE